MLITTVIVMIITVASRAAALVANSMITASFGVTALTGAYSFALNLTNIITTVIGTTLTTSVIPIYTELKEKRDIRRTDDFLNNTFSLTVLTGLILIAVGAAAAPLFAKMASGGDYSFTVYAIRVLLFAVIFISLYYILSGILQANGRFYIAAAVSIPSSLAGIIYLVFLSDRFGIRGLCAATLIGFFLQAFILVPSYSRLGHRFRLSFDYKNEDMFKIFRVVAPVIVGVCAYQINLLTNSSIAFGYDPNRYVLLNNAQNLGIQIVMTIVLAVASVVYPKLSILNAKGDSGGFSEQFISTMSGIILMLLPISFGFFAYSREVMDLVYGYGKFTPEDVTRAGQAFACYSFAVLGIGFKEITDRAFYALKNTKTPAWNGVVIMVINIVLSVITVKRLGLNGIALSYSAAALAGGLNILFLFRKKVPEITLKPLVTAFFKSLAACAVMFLVIIFLKRSLGTAATKPELILNCVISGGAGVIAYGAVLAVLKTKELEFIKKAVKRRNGEF